MRAPPTFPDPILLSRQLDALREALAAVPRPLVGATWADGGTFLISRDTSGAPEAWRVTVLERDGVPVGHVGPCTFAHAVEAGCSIGPVSKIAPYEA